jgi:hypothetical protein
MASLTAVTSTFVYEDEYLDAEAGPFLTPSENYGGYALVSYKSAGGDETPRFEAIITLNGKKIAYVSNGGTGGSNMTQPFAAQGGWAAIRTLEDFAAEWAKGSQYAGIEDSDSLVYRLIEVVRTNRMRCVPYLLDGLDFWGTGEHYKAKAGFTYEQVVKGLSTPKYAARNPQVWNKKIGAFVAI